MNLLKKFKDRIASLEILAKVGAGAITVVATVAAFFVQSRTLAYTLAGAALVGGLVGFSYCAWRLNDLNAKSRSKLARHCTWAAIVALVLVVAVLALADPGVAAMAGLLEAAREYLITSMLVYNAVIAAGAFFCLAFAVAAIVAVAPAMSNGPR